jgi:flagellar biosynthesis chaperone FliJ
MKQSMDNALALQQTVNESLQKGLASAQMPSSNDADHVVMLIRGMEERLADKIDKLTERMGKLEKARPKPAVKPSRKG